LDSNKSLSLSVQADKHIMHPCMRPTLLLLMLLASAELTAAARYTSLPHKGWPRQHSVGKHLLQYTGAVVAGNTPTSSTVCCCPSAPPATGSSSYKSTAFAPNPAVKEASSAMKTGGTPSDIASLKGKGYVKGNIMGRSIDASGQASASCGCNSCGGITACGSAEGDCCICGPAGSFDAQGQARAAAATAKGSNAASGAAAAGASGCFLMCKPDGSTVQGQGRAGAGAQGSVVHTPPKTGVGARPK
jgi:hypothetical protein